MNILARKFLINNIFKNEIFTCKFRFTFSNSLNTGIFNKYSIFSFSENSKNNGKDNTGKVKPTNTTIPRSELRKMVKDKNNSDIVKTQTTSRGPGGQHTNKTASAVLLKDKKTNISVKVQNSRDSVVNSGIATKRLVDKLDLHYNGSESKIAKKIEKAKKQKDRQKRKREKKEGEGENNSSSASGDYNFFN
jgi:peptide chain release factor